MAETTDALLAAVKSYHYTARAGADAASMDARRRALAANIDQSSPPQVSALEKMRLHNELEQSRQSADRKVVERSDEPASAFASDVTISVLA